jgi:hypothetical protein
MKTVQAGTIVSIAFWIAPVVCETRTFDVAGPRDFEEGLGDPRVLFFFSFSTDHLDRRPLRKISQIR